MRHRLPNQLAEVRRKSEAVVERETALKWAGRAVACLREHARTKQLGWLIRAEHYRDEALEHAAMVGDHGRLVREVQSAIDGESGASALKKVQSGRKRRRRNRRAR